MAYSVWEQATSLTKYCWKDVQGWEPRVREQARQARQEKPRYNMGQGGRHS